MRVGHCAVRAENPVELGDLDDPANLGVGRHYADADADVVPLLVALQQGIETGATEVRHPREFDDQQLCRMIRGHLEGPVEMGDEHRGATRVDFARG